MQQLLVYGFKALVSLLLTCCYCTQNVMWAFEKLINLGSQLLDIKENIYKACAVYICLD